jgi:hypothetical protein
MGKRGDGYGSEDQLHRYLDERREEITAAVASALGDPAQPIEWLDFPRTDGREREYRGLEFLAGPEYADTRDAWATVWPTTGRQPSWDAIARAGDRWLLVEAKANAPEFVTPPCKATPDAHKLIVKALNATKRELGVDRFYAWDASYYQYANRLTVLRFLRERAVDAHLVFVYFTGDAFPDGTPCPAIAAEWEELIEARRLTLGLPQRHALGDYDHHVFLPAHAGARALVRADAAAD